MLGGVAAADRRGVGRDSARGAGARSQGQTGGELPTPRHRDLKEPGARAGGGWVDLERRQRRRGAEGALDALHEPFADPRVGLSFGGWVEHRPDGKDLAPSDPVRDGPSRTRTLGRIWEDERWMPIHLAGAMTRTSAVLAEGGSSTLVGGSDIGLMLTSTQRGGVPPRPPRPSATTTTKISTAAPA